MRHHFLVTRTSAIKKKIISVDENVENLKLSQSVHENGTAAL